MAPTYSAQERPFARRSQEWVSFEALHFSRNCETTASEPAVGSLTIVSSVIDLPWNRSSSLQAAADPACLLVGGRGLEQHDPHDGRLSTSRERACHERERPIRELAALHKAGQQVRARAGQAAPINRATYEHQQQVEAPPPKRRP